jgi:hypothetical protein
LGTLDQLKNSVSDFLEVAGGQFAPLVGEAAKQLTAMFNSISAGKGNFELLTLVLHGALITISTLVATGEMLATVIGTKLASAFSALTSFLSGDFKQAEQTWKDGFAVAAEDVEAIWKKHNERVAGYSQARLDAEQIALDNEVKMTEDSLAKKEKARRDMQQKEAESEFRMLGEKEKLLSAQNTLEEEKRNEAFISATASHEEKRIAEIDDSNREIEAQIALNEVKIAQTTDHVEKVRLAKENAALNEDLRENQKNANDLKRTDAHNKQKEQFTSATLSTIATLSRSSNQTLASIGKAAGIAQIAIATPVAISQAMASGIPYPLNMVAAGLVAAAMAAQAANLAGVPLAEGGIVQARPGGIQATIGEGGQDEAVIPLDGNNALGSVTIIVNGGLLGDESSARMLARALDKQLLRLRQNNESVAFGDVF